MLVQTHTKPPLTSDIESRRWLASNLTLLLASRYALFYPSMQSEISNVVGNCARPASELGYLDKQEEHLVE